MNHLKTIFKENIITALKVQGLIILLLLFAPCISYSQKEAVFEISGKVIDAVTGKGLAYASVQLISVSDTLYTKGIISDEKGRFLFSKVPFSTYKLSVSYMGFEKKDVSITTTTKKNFADIRLIKKEYSLSGVTISEEKQLLEQNIEKKTINISGNEITTAGTAIDVLQTLPSVDIDINGEVRYRGSEKVTLLLNGKQSAMIKTLDQIPAAMIEKIEIINNPMAKYEAEGIAGIINVILKTENDQQNKSSVRLFAGLPEIFGGNIGYSGLNGKHNFFVNGGYDHKLKFQTKEHLRKNYENPLVPDYYQYDFQDEHLNNVLLNAGYFFQPNDRHHFSFSLLGTKKFNSAEREINYITLENELQNYASHKDISISLDNYVIDGVLNYQYHFAREGQNLIANLHYTILDQLQEMNHILYPESSLEEITYQNTYSAQFNNESSFSIDYTDPMKESFLFEAGYQYNHQDLLNDFYAENLNSVTSIWENDTSLASRFDFLQDIHALYASTKLSIKSFSFLVGIRGEYTSNELVNKIKNKYLNIFPAITTSHQASEHLSLYISWNRRINRPTIKMLNPYTTEYADILNMHIGNPDLQAEYVSSFEIGFHQIADKFSLSGATYFKNIRQAISRVKSATNDSALLVTFMNLEHAQLFGGDISISLRPAKWWDVTVDANIFHTDLNGNYGPNEIKRSFTGWTGNFSNKIKLPLDIGFQFSGHYRSKLPDVMGTYKERYYFDLSLYKKVMKGKGKMVFKASDVFNTYRYGLDLVGIDESGFAYSQRNRRKNESQYFILSFIYNLENKENSGKKTQYYLETYGK